MPEHLPSPEEVPALRDVVSALARARRVAGSGPGFVVCICNDDGQRIAKSTLASYEQVQRFSRDMVKLGYAAHPVNLARDMHDCDVVYWKQDSARDIFDNGAQIDTGPGAL